jgi:hypothetical protein
MLRLAILLKLCHTGRMGVTKLRFVSLLSVIVFGVSAMGLQLQPQPVAAKKQGCTPVPANAVAWWPGDSVTSANDIVGKNHGSMQNGAALVPGLVGDSFGFDGLDDMVVVPNTAELSAAGAFTVEFWFSPVSTISPTDPVSHVFWSKGFDNSIDTGNSQGIVEVRGPSPRPISTTDTWAGGAWHHLALTYDGGQYILYVNGVPQGAEASSYSLINNGDEIVFGRLLASALSNFGGRLDEITQYNRALGSGEIQQIVAAQDAGKCKVPNYRLPFVDGPFNITNGPGCGSEVKKTKHEGSQAQAIDYDLDFYPIVATEVGKVVHAGPATTGGWGDYIKIEHVDGTTSVYAHLSDIDVAVGDYVTKGQSIGVSGDSGRAVGQAHLHFQVNDGNKAVDIRTLPTTTWSPGTVEEPCNPDGPIDGTATGPAV